MRRVRVLGLRRGALLVGALALATAIEALPPGGAIAQDSPIQQAAKGKVQAATFTTPDGIEREAPFLSACSPMKQSAINRIRVVVSFSLFSNLRIQIAHEHSSFDQRRFSIRKRNSQLMDELLTFANDDLFVFRVLGFDHPLFSFPGSHVKTVT